MVLLVYIALSLLALFLGFLKAALTLLFFQSTFTSQGLAQCYLRIKKPYYYLYYDYYC